VPRYGPPAYILHWVDDLVIACRGERAAEIIKAAVLTKFKGRDLGPAEAYLGVRIERDRRARVLKLSQPLHLQRLLTDAGMTDAKSKAIPMAHGAQPWHAAHKPAPLDDAAANQYRRTVGGLLYVANVTRPDLSCAVAMLSRYFSQPHAYHAQLLQQLLRYVASTLDMALCYGGQSKLQLQAWTDSDYATCKDTRRSRTGWLFTLNNGAVSWKSQLQTVVAQSTAESEYIAGASAAKEAVWLHRVCFRLGVPAEGPVVLRADNQAAIFMASAGADSSRTKHIDVVYHFLRQCVARYQLRLLHVPTDDNPADMFTKPLADIKFCKFRAMLGLR